MTTSSAPAPHPRSVVHKERSLDIVLIIAFCLVCFVAPLVALGWREHKRGKKITIGPVTIAPPPPPQG